MTFRSSISSKGNPRDFLKRGFKSMFPNYDKKEETTSTIATEQQNRKQPPAE